MTSFIQHQQNLILWANTFHSTQDVIDGHFDAAGFDGWDAIEQDFDAVVQQHSLTRIVGDERAALCWLLARSWDLGRMLAWLSRPFLRLSNTTTLSDEDFFTIVEWSLDPENSVDSDLHMQCGTLLVHMPGHEQQRGQLLVRLLWSKYGAALWRNGPHLANAEAARTLMVLVAALVEQRVAIAPYEQAFVTTAFALLNVDQLGGAADWSSLLAQLRVAT